MSGAYGLTIKQEKFADRYLEHGSGIRAREEAGYATKGWSKNAQYVDAHKLLNNPKIALRIKLVKEAVVKRVEYTLEQALKDAREDREMARDLGQLGAAVSANKLAAEMSGYINRKTDLNIQINTWSEVLDIVAENTGEHKDDSGSVH